MRVCFAVFRHPACVHRDGGVLPSHGVYTLMVAARSFFSFSGGNISHSFVIRPTAVAMNLNVRPAVVSFFDSENKQTQVCSSCSCSSAAVVCECVGECVCVCVCVCVCMFELDARCDSPSLSCLLCVCILLLGDTLEHLLHREHALRDLRLLHHRHRRLC
jgi:hypothetical protein